MTTNLQKLIDDYGDLQTAMGRLESKKLELQAALADLPPGAYESERYRLSICDSVRESPDKVLADKIKIVVADYRLALTPQYLTAHTVKTTVRTHRVSVPTGKGLAT